MICQKDFRELCFGGIPDKPGLRQTCWKVLLGYLPLDKSRWDSVLMEQRRLYYAKALMSYTSFVKDLIVEPELSDMELSLQDEESLKEKDREKWTLFFQDNKTLEQIDKDVRRTLPDFAFFQLPIPYSPLCPLSIEPGTRKPKSNIANAPTPDETEHSSTLVVASADGLTATTTPSPTATVAPGLTPRLGNLQASGIESRRGSLGARALTPTLKRRQTVTLMSPHANKNREKTNETEPWTGSTKAVESGTETPPYAVANGFKTPNNYPSPLPSKLRGMTTALTENSSSEEAPLPDYLFSPIPTRRSLFKRVAHLNQDFGSREHQPHSLQASRTQENWLKKRRAQNELLANGASSPPELSLQPPKGENDKGNDSDDNDNDDHSLNDELPQDLHWEAIERVLFIYAKLNPGVGYVQGMNEILGPLYYLLANDVEETNRAHAEAESFWLFHLLMAHFRDHFVRSLDRDRTSGIGSTIARMNSRLRQFDEYLWQNLEDKGIAPEYYSFRWLTVLCTQEFEVPDVWRIWDSVLADTGGIERDYDFLLDFGCAMVCHLREELLAGDFADNVKLLQNYPPVDIQPILYLATVIREERTNKIMRPLTTHDGSSSNSGTGINRDGASTHQSRPSIDLRIWSSRSSVHDLQLSSSDSVSSDLKALTIDGVQNSDRLDHNLEGIDHRSPMYTPNSNAFRDNPQQTNVSRSGGGLPGLNLDGLWSKSAGPSRSSSRPVSARERHQHSPSSLSVDSYTMNAKESRPQTGTWAEAFSQFKARLVGSGNSPDAGSVPTLSTVAPGEGVGALSPSAEI
ncbi:hypothetical protein BGZ94_007874 [Podila epigama]|nr:hypothetical protein BGZ94_007874 [Podila epigama]